MAAPHTRRIQPSYRRTASRMACRYMRINSSDFAGTRTKKSAADQNGILDRKESVSAITSASSRRVKLASRLRYGVGVRPEERAGRRVACRLGGPLRDRRTVAAMYPAAVPTEPQMAATTNAASTEAPGTATPTTKPTTVQATAGNAMRTSSSTGPTAVEVVIERWFDATWTYHPQSCLSNPLDIIASSRRESHCVSLFLPVH